MQQGLKEMLGLARGFALLGEQAFVLLDDAREFLLERERWNGNLHYPKYRRIDK
jgi:hypothetical protein